MEYSLLKLKPSLQSLLTPRTGNCVLKGAGSSLYSLLDSSGEGVKGLRVRMLDGLTGKDYEVDRYERYKAGLLGRVWLKRSSESNPKLVTDLEALGVKWQVITEGR